ncbi:glycoside hydrolase family 113 [[Clostridium] polysaccharolyticum]|uniref:Uncharacterized protein n=1 Tax=[Clostridium] polysaccharolyticum TaxID=29364 RepID=A0A1H9ZZC0_9FIRM|nr:hypothetical protein [[Clostridium] polysaccharolyticum]SES86767.1 hypothetical protein SAMN04487772_104170 [[Clostridium] polysaccharolyticum]
MNNIKAINYTGFNYQCIGEEQTKENLRIMKKLTACNTVIIVLGALQEDSKSVYIDYQHAIMPKDSDLIDFIRYARKLELKVFLKPVIDCQDGSSRTGIQFFKASTAQENLWNQWYESYQKFILHYAKIAEKTRCEMFYIGSCLTKLMDRPDAWNDLIKQVRSCYQGKVTYEAEAYQEQKVPFWKELDAIATNGSFAKQDFQKELERIEKLALSCKKPLYLTECGCMSTIGASADPGRWQLEGKISLQEQVEYLEEVFIQCNRKSCVKGIGIWCWNNRRQSRNTAVKDKRYYIYGKPVCEFIFDEWSSESEIKQAI